MSGKVRDGVVRVGRAFCGGFVEAARHVGESSDFGWGIEFLRTDVVMGGERDGFWRSGERGVCDSGLAHAAGYI